MYLFLLFSALPHGVLGQISVDASSSAITTGNTNSLSWSHTVSSGSNRLLIVSVSIRANEPVTSVSYGGNPMSAWTQVAGLTETANKVRGEVWYMKAPPVGTANVVVTLGSNKTFVAGATSFFNVDQTTPLGAAVSNQGSGGDPNNISPSLPISSAVGELAFDFVAVSRGTSSPTPPTTGSGQSILWSDYNGILSSDGFGASSTKPGSPSVSMTWNVDVVAGAGEWVWIGTAIKPATANLPPTATDRALLFDGTDVVVIPPQPGLVMNATMTMEALVQRTGTPTGTEIIVNKEGEYELGITSTGVLQWAFANTTPGWNWISTGIQLPLDEWVHVAVTYNAGVIRSFVNGTLVDQVNGTGGLGDVYPAMNDLTIGGRQNATTQRWIGYIDEVRVWGVARTPAQIAAAYNTVLAGTEPDLRGYWRFSEPAGLTTADGSPNGYTGTLGNGVPAGVPVRMIHYSTPEETLLTVGAPGALTAATDLDGDPLTAVLVTPPANAASFTLNPDGSFSYLPATDFNGIDSIIFMANDGTNNSTPAVVTLVVNPVSDIRGRVFEDQNYGGGAGRDRATAQGNGGTGRPNARVELYDAAGNFVSATNTNPSGDYNFSGIPAGDYTVRVVNSSVSSSRAGYVPGTHLAVQTFRTDASSGTALGIADHVGGELPDKADAGIGSTTLAVLNTPTTAAQSITSLTIGTNDVLNVDFGYSFDVICNTNNAGQGSLRQFIANANALANAGLAIQGQAAGRDVSIFMIADGSASPGLNPGMPDLLTSGVARIDLTTALPAITEAVTVDGSLQTALVGNTNAGTVGTGGTVGVDAVPLASFEKPEVEINAGDNTGFAIAANVSNVNLEHMAVFNASTGVAVSGGTGSGNTMRGLFIGTDAQGANPGGALRNTVNGIIFNSPASGIVANCLAAYNGQSGIIAAQPSASMTATGNEVFGNGWNSNGHDGLDIDGANCVVRYNLTYGNTNAAGAPSGGSGSGIEMGSSGLPGNMNNLIENNTSRDNVSNGLTVRSGANGNTIRKNILTGNNIGVLVAREGSTARNNVITENSIHSNAQLGIDLSSAAAGGDGVTLNDMGDVDAGSNDLLNTPVLFTAWIVGANLEVKGSATAGSSIEFFISDNDPSGFGEGQTYLFTAVEGSGADLDATTGTYGPGAINGIAQGTDNASRFSFSVPVPTGVVDGSQLTATARIASNTSEFAARVIATDDLDLDDDGIPNSLELGDTDGDGVLDELDLDSDNDGIYDCVESGVFAPQTNGVLSGAVNVYGIPMAADTNGDGTIDYALSDSDSDGNHDFAELDSDGDGCTDVKEAGFVDTNADGTPGNAPITVDANGLVTSLTP